MAAVVYLLCGLTSIICVVLLVRAYLRTQLRLLFWSSLCFGGFALNNATLFYDKVVVPDTDLTVLRSVPVLLGVICMIYGMIWESDR
jgi:hypothetical protein